MRKSVLIIDDDIVSQFALKYTIRQTNVDCVVSVCDGAQEGLRILCDAIEKRRDLPDVIFLDLDMPTLDGWDFLERYSAIVDTLHSTKIFILSAFASSRDRARAMDHAMVDGFYDKPLSRNGATQILKSMPD